MFKNNQHNLYVLALFFVLFLWGQFQLLGKPAWHLRKSYREHKAWIQFVSQGIRNPGSGLDPVGDERIREWTTAASFERISQLSRKNGLQIRSFPEAVRFAEGSYTVDTRTLEVEGSFSGITRFVYALEQEERLGIIRSLRYFLHSDKVGKKTVLRAGLMIQNPGKDPEE